MLKAGYMPLKPESQVDKQLPGLRFSIVFKQILESVIIPNFQQEEGYIEANPPLSVKDKRVYIIFGKAKIIIPNTYRN